MPSQNTKPADYPQAVLQQIALLAQNIVIARKRRKETQAQWAQRRLRAITMFCASNAIC